MMFRKKQTLKETLFIELQTIISFTTNGQYLIDW